ncbi:unnamed protein product [Arabis nemorensis]|uniref:Uncharacterized protein n=1 Tax=Arabis nemorensis TaxID=586526 RepID=A0A565B1Q5_9BRAS|nr:unnamed protein product [Arabis nemorensis]
MGFLADRIVNASSLEVRVGATALLLCAAKEKKQLITEALDLSDTGDFYFPDPAKILGGTVALWLLCILTSVDAKSKLIVMEAGGLEVLHGKLVRVPSLEMK